MNKQNHVLVSTKVSKQNNVSNSWLESLPELQREFVVDCINSVIDFSVGEYKDFFDYCALYACGSSLNSKKPHDVDLVLVGLDFRSVVKYDKIFLQDPETLIEQDIVEEPCVFQVEQEENGEPTILKPVEHNTLEGMCRLGIEHNGKRYDYNVDKCGHQGVLLENFCANSAGYSELVENLFTHLVKKVGHPNQGNYYGHSHDPFDKYFHGEEYFLTTPLTLYSQKIKFDGDQPVPDEIRIPVLPIDFRIHTENLLVTNWEQHQNDLGFPFELLYAWSKSKITDAGVRSYLTQENQPSFIDKNGKNRVQWHPYFSYLREPPIEIKTSN